MSNLNWFFSNFLNYYFYVIMKMEIAYPASAAAAEEDSEAEDVFMADFSKDKRNKTRR